MGLMWSKPNVEMKFPMKLLTHDALRSHGEIPRSDHEIDYLTLDDIKMKDRSRCFILFISHNREGPADPHPDHIAEKYEIILVALEKLAQVLGEGTEIFIWVDFFCIDQDNRENQIKGIDSLSAYIAESDGLLTPYSDKMYVKEEGAEFGGPLDDFWPNGWSKKYKSLSNESDQYLGRAWCRLEIYLGSNAPLPDEGYRYFKKLGIHLKGRPHFLSGDEADGLLILMPLLTGSTMKLLSPMDGALTNEADRPLIKDIVDKFPEQHETKEEYIGDMKDGKRHGYGEMHYLNGNYYKGDWENDEWNGKGIIERANGQRYEGGVKNNTHHGHGVLMFASGDKYDGPWENGKQQGQGIWYMPNGDRFEGTWEGGLIHGTGIKYCKDGSTVTEVWERSKKIKTIKTEDA